MRRSLAPLVLVLAALTLPSAAAAAGSNAPPGNSGVDQYFETIPSAGGNHPAARGAKPGAGGLSAAERRRLAAAGPAGAAAADLAAANAPRRARHHHGPGATTTAPLPSAAGRSPFSTALHAVSGSDSSGLGILLPLILGATLLAGILAVAVRRRSSQAS
jgi:hypothetical protein